MADDGSSTLEGGLRIKGGGKNDISHFLHLIFVDFPCAGSILTRGCSCVSLDVKTR